MEFGDPVIYNCPSCGKPMKMTSYLSYTVRKSDIFSDGSSTGRPHFTPDLAKCPRCKKLFFRHTVKGKTMSMREADKIKDIKDPDRADLIKALKQKIAKDRKQEKILREDLWRELNKTTRRGDEILEGEEYQLWKDNCAALLPLTEKAYEKMLLPKNSEKYDDDDKDNCLITIAELNRNIGNFDKCKELIKQLNRDWSWLKKQYLAECKAKNPFAFELLSERVLNLDKNGAMDEYDYIDRAQIYLAKYYGRRNVEKAIADFTKALSLASDDGARLNILNFRCCAYTEIGDHDKALADTQAMEEIESKMEQ